MKYILLLVALFASQVQAAKQETSLALTFLNLQTDVMEYVHKSPGKWVKYSGSFGFGYPYKTTPQAMSDGSVDYYTYSRCVEANGVIYMIVYVADTDGNKTLLRRIYSNQCDPHENAAIYVDGDGYIKVVQSARGKWRKGYEFKSLRPNDISEFENTGSGFYAYPKLHKNGMIYTSYEGSLRETWIKTEFDEKKLVRGGAYAITTEHNGEIHMAYNYHFNGNLDARVNLYYMWSPDGEKWFNYHGEALALPVAENSNKTAISFDYHKFNYLKDISFVDGEIQALVVQSNSSDPTKGSRELVKFTMDGESKLITNIGHNYDGAQFWNDSIIAVKNNRHSYAGGDLFQYSLSGEYIGTYRGEGKANYPVAVKNSDKLMFADSKGLFISE